jgi:hypothetical protein
MIPRFKCFGRLAGATLLTASLAGCFVGDVLPTGDHSSGSPSPPAPPAPAPAVPAPATLDPPHLARRLALDLALKLPAQADLDLLNADPTQADALIDSYLDDGAASAALAAMHPRMWHLDSRKLPDLDGFVAAGDTALGKALTPEVRQAIVDEPSLLMRHMLEQRLPFSEALTAGFAVADPSVLSLWNLTDDGVAFAGASYHVGAYSDGRPAAGLLASNGLAAAIPTHSDAMPRARAARLLTEIVCLGLEQPAAHAFTDLTAAELKLDLATLAVTRAPCAGCHLQIETAAGAFAGLGAGTSFSTWLAYAAPGVPLTGAYAGYPFTGATAFAADIANDPRTHRCELTKLAQAVYQRQASANDMPSLDLAVNDFYAADLSVKDAAKRIFQSPEYSYDVVDPSLKAPYLRGSSGVRLLGLAQWRGIVAELAPAADLALTDDLDPGHDETVTGDDSVPSGGYWHRVDQTARLAASAIVDAELADNAFAIDRRLLTDLPDGAGYKASAAVINQQLKDAWLRLTAVTLQDTDQTFLDLQTLWSSAQPGSTAASFRRAWRTVLVGMLTHPAFLTY